MMYYVKLTIVIAEEYRDALIAELSELGFDGFELQKDRLITYLPSDSFNDTERERVERVLNVCPGSGYMESEEPVAGRNWNEQWEKTIEPLQIGEFFVRPTWSEREPEEESVLLEIDPKMAFGTGYHETTRLIMKLLPEVIDRGDRVLDTGTGTGILAIASAQLGARKVFAHDIDEWSIKNATENIVLNRVDERVMVKKGGGEVIPAHEHFDVVLVNIERNTLLELLPTLDKALKKDGRILLSGFLKMDSDMVIDRLNKQKLEVVEQFVENDWIALKAQKVI